MRYIYSEAQNKYSNYLFSYQVLLLEEKGDSVDEIYNKGFLPIRSIGGLYYLARSCRVDISEFVLSSENRRVLKKMENTKVAQKPIKDVNKDDFNFLHKDYLNDAATRRIFSISGNFNCAFTFGKKGLVATKVTEN